MQGTWSKELPPLAIPWGIAAVAALIRSLSPDQESLLSALTSLSFFAGVAMLSAVSFGAEFQHRTLPLLLSQPVTRARVWREKIFLLFIVVASLPLLYWQ